MKWVPRPNRRSYQQGARIAQGSFLSFLLFYGVQVLCLPTFFLARQPCHRVQSSPVFLSSLSCPLLSSLVVGVLCPLPVRFGRFLALFFFPSDSVVLQLSSGRDCLACDCRPMLPVCKQCTFVFVEARCSVQCSQMESNAHLSAPLHTHIRSTLHGVPASCIEHQS